MRCAVGLCDDGCVLLGKRIPTLLRALLRVVDGEHSRDRLLLQPLARIPDVDPGRDRQLGFGQSFRAAQRFVQTEPVTEVSS